MTLKPVDEPVQYVEDVLDGVRCVDDACPGRPCADRTCWLREGYRLAVDVAREAAAEDGAPGWLPGRMCDAATWLVPGWELAGSDYSPQAEVDEPVHRGEVWTVSGGVYAHKPRPAVVVQDGVFGWIGSVTVCPLTTQSAQAPVVRIAVDPTTENGLAQLSYVMVDKITTTSRTKIHRRLGVLAAADMTKVDRALLSYLHGVA